MDRLHWSIASPAERQRATDDAERSLGQFVAEIDSIGSAEEMDRHVLNIGTTPTPSGDLALTKQGTWKMSQTQAVNPFGDSTGVPDAQVGNDVLVAVGGLGWQSGSPYARESGEVRRISRDAYYVQFASENQNRLEDAYLWVHKDLVVDVLGTKK